MLIHGICDSNAHPAHFSQEFVEQSSKSIFQAAYDLVRSCLTNYITQVDKVVVEKAGTHVDNEVIICSESILVCFSGTSGFEKLKSLRKKRSFVIY